MRLMSNIRPTFTVSTVTECLPSTLTIEYLDELDRQIHERITTASIRMAALKAAHCRQSMCMADIQELIKVFPEKQDFLTKVVVTVNPSQTSFTLVITSLYDCCTAELIDIANEVMQRYIEVLPVATDEDESGVRATATVRTLCETLDVLYKRAALTSIPVDKILPIYTVLHSVKLQSNTPPSDPVHLLRAVSANNLCKEIVHLLATAKTLLHMAAHQKHSSLDGLTNKLSLIISANNLLNIARIIPLVKNLSE